MWLCVVGNAKNVLTIGSSQSNDFEITNELLGFKCVSGFSSRGPTLDGRIKPDIVAPGECVSISLQSNMPIMRANIWLFKLTQTCLCAYVFLCHRS